MPSSVGPRCDGDADALAAGEDMRVVRLGEDRLGEIGADLRGGDVERGAELDVAHMIAAELDMHEAGHRFGGVGVAIEMHALHERRRAIADADDGDPELAQPYPPCPRAAP